MGIARSETVENALYGFKGDIKESLRDGRVPDWMHPHSPQVWAGDDNPAETIDPVEQSPRTFLSRTKAKMKRCDGGIAQFEVHGRPSSLNGRSYSLNNSLNSQTFPPGRIRQKLVSYLDGRHQDVLNWLRDGEFYRGLFVTIHFGPQAGIQDLYIEAVYEKN